MSISPATAKNNVQQVIFSHVTPALKSYPVVLAIFKAMHWLYQLWYWNRKQEIYQATNLSKLVAGGLTSVLLGKSQFVRLAALIVFVINRIFFCIEQVNRIVHICKNIHRIVHDRLPQRQCLEWTTQTPYGIVSPHFSNKLKRIHLFIKTKVVLIAKQLVKLFKAFIALNMAMIDATHAFRRYADKTQEHVFEVFVNVDEIIEQIAHHPDELIGIIRERAPIIDAVLKAFGLTTYTAEDLIAFIEEHSGTVEFAKKIVKFLGKFIVYAGKKAVNVIASKVLRERPPQWAMVDSFESEMKGQKTLPGPSSFLAITE